MSLISSTATSDASTVVVGSQQLAAMVAGQKYRLVSTTNAWIKFGANPTAAVATDDNHYLPANSPIEILCQGAAVKVAIIRDTADGTCSLSLIL